MMMQVPGVPSNWPNKQYARDKIVHPNKHVHGYPELLFCELIYSSNENNCGMYLIIASPTRL
jgi:hypothetical protein